MDVKDAYNRWSATYDTDNNFTRDLDYQVTQRVFEAASFNSILEIGCGTGKNTPVFAQAGSRVHALDFSPRMLSQARRELRLPNLSFLLADLSRQWPLRDQSYDLVACNLVLEHIQDLDFIFAEVHRLLIPAGRFFLCELHPFKGYQGLQATFHSPEGPIPITAYLHHLSEYFSLAQKHHLRLLDLKEYWHPQDQDKPPRLLSLLFEKQPAQ